MQLNSDQQLPEGKKKEGYRERISKDKITSPEQDIAQDKFSALVFLLSMDKVIKNVYGTYTSAKSTVCAT